MASDERYDAASIVGLMAGLGGDQPTRRVVTPTDLIARFCDETTATELATTHGPRPEGDDEGVTVARGHCGYQGGRGDQMVTGFDDGHDFLGYLIERGWRPVPEKGQWPYLVWVYWPAQDGQQAAFAVYQERDLAVWQFASQDAVHRFFATLKDAQ